MDCWGALLFPMCSPKVLKATCKVLNVFPKMFPMACHFYPICSAQSCTPLTYIYIGGPKGEKALNILTLRIETSIFESLHNFSIIFCGWANNQNGSFATKAKLLNLGTLNPKLLNLGTLNPKLLNLEP